MASGHLFEAQIHVETFVHSTSDMLILQSQILYTFSVSITVDFLGNEGIWYWILTQCLSDLREGPNLHNYHYNVIIMIIHGLNDDYSINQLIINYDIRDAYWYRAQIFCAKGDHTISRAALQQNIAFCRFWSWYTYPAVWKTVKIRWDITTHTGKCALSHHWFSL